MAAIEFDNVSFSYRGGPKALDRLDLRIEAGTFTCVLGGNGSGKSTLARHVNALLVPDEGIVRVLGRDTGDPAQTYAIRADAGMVFQNPDDQLVASIVEDDVAFGPGNLGVEPGELRARVDGALRQVGLADLGKAEVAALSGGQKQLVAIAGALAMRPRVLVLDEASAMLDPRGRSSLMRVCRELNAGGLTIVFITHFMEEAVQADRVIVLDRGRVALDGAPREVLTQVERLEALALEPPFAARVSHGRCLTVSELLACPDSLDLPDSPRSRTAPSSDAQPASRPAPPAIRLENVTYEYRTWALRDITLDVRRGEIFGIAGHTGSGKSTLIQLAGGLLKPAAGTVSAGERRKTGVVFQYPERQLFAATVFEDVAFGPRNLGLGPDEVEARVEEALALVHLDFGELGDMSPFSLSGGQQRRVAIAGVLAMHPETLIFDEPTAGLDPRARNALLSLVSELHEQGRTIVLVSHNMDDLARLCDRLAVLNEGRLAMAGTPAEVFSNESLLREAGLELPQRMQLENALARRRAAGCPSRAS